MCPDWGCRWPLMVSALLCGVSMARAEAPVASGVAVHVISNGWHAGLLLPAAPLNALVPGLGLRFPQAQAYEVGWGDMGFYQARELTVGLALQALFDSRGSLLHVVGVSRPTQAMVLSDDTATVCVSALQLHHMARFVALAFEQGPDGKPLPAGPGLYGDSQFYQARGRYSWRHTCNRWTAQALAAGGLPLSSAWHLTAGSVLSAVRTARPDGRCAEPGP